MSVAQPVRFSSKLQACPGDDLGPTPRVPLKPHFRLLRWLGRQDGLPRASLPGAGLGTDPTTEQQELKGKPVALS